MSDYITYIQTPQEFMDGWIPELGEILKDGLKDFGEEQSGINAYYWTVWGETGLRSGPSLGVEWPIQEFELENICGVFYD